MKELGFLQKFIRLVKASEGNRFDDNYDYRRFGPLVESGETDNLSPGFYEKTKACFDCLLRCLRLRHTPTWTERAMQWIRPRQEQFEWLHEALDDNFSRELLVQVLAFRLMGHKKIKLPLNNAEYWRQYSEVEAMTSGKETLPLGFRGWEAYRVNLQAYGYPIELYARPGAVMGQLLLQQYRCPLAKGSIEVKPGDTVIDGGACYGDSALYFAHKAGLTGQVYSFEFLPENVHVFEQNMELNPKLRRCIKRIDHPLWSCSGVELFVEGNGPGTRVCPDSESPTARKVTTMSIDDLVRRERLEKVDFIKMDIEGSELAALKGAKETICRFAPKLAISVYHHIEDFWELPQWIDALGLGYKFHLRHFTIHAEETVLFASVDE
ncbi:MAG: hypothetical protein C0616_00300 [Desulfuromonas sp.]|nr:MAG: hypothetical protein C0616_00300 [Desulfuromonas sp.]